VSALILDAGVLLAVDRSDRAAVARLRAALQHGLELRTNAMVVAQPWRDRHGRQVSLARLLQRGPSVKPSLPRRPEAAATMRDLAG
jgi:hypothetical protein